MDDIDLQALVDDIERHAPDDPLDRLVAATLRHAELADLADQLLDHFVQAARSAGCTWNQIGEALGVSKQAAQQRHGAGDEAFDGLVEWMRRRGLGRRRFDRFTERARDAVVAAQQAARDLGHPLVGTEHALIGLLDDPDSLASRLLHGWSVTRDDVVAEVRRRVTPGESESESGGDATGSAPAGHIPFSPRAKKAADLTLRQALSLGHNYIGTEHILLGVIQAEGLGAQILHDRGVSLPRARQAVIEALVGRAR
jgi:hypothetical protein